MIFVWLTYSVDEGTENERVRVCCVLCRQAFHGLPRSAPIASCQLAWPPTKILSRFGSQYFVHEDLIRRAMVLKYLQDEAEIWLCRLQIVLLKAHVRLLRNLMPSGWLNQRSGIIERSNDDSEQWKWVEWMNDFWSWGHLGKLTSS